jgi:hypothetical protein
VRHLRKSCIRTTKWALRGGIKKGLFHFDLMFTLKICRPIVHCGLRRYQLGDSDGNWQCTINRYCYTSNFLRVTAFYGNTAWYNIVFHGFLLKHLFNTVLSTEYLWRCPKNIFDPVSNMGHKRNNEWYGYMIIFILQVHFHVSSKPDPAPKRIHVKVNLSP